MKQEDKELLLKDLSARLPYGVIMNTPNGDGYLNSINRTIFGNEYVINIFATRIDYFSDDENNFKPYLRSMSSMTEEEEIYYNTIYTTLKFYEREDWLNAHHFDFRNLIERGLAIKVTEENNPYKK